MSNPDRALAGLVLALLAGAAVVRPVWRAVDPRTAEIAAVEDALDRATVHDPWGTPWCQLNWVDSAGPDRTLGTADDVLVERVRGSRQITALYVKSPLVLVGLVLLLLQVRYVSGAVPRRRSSALVAAGLALMPTGLTIGGLGAIDLLDPLLKANPTGVAWPALALFGSVYAAFVMLIFAHRQLTPSATGPDTECHRP